MQNGTLKTYRTRAGSGGPGVTSILEDRSGTVWFGTAGYRTGGLCTIKANQPLCTSIPGGGENPGIYSLLADRNGNLWVGGFGRLLRWPAEPRNAFRLRQRQGIVRSLTELGNNEIWAATSTRGAVERLANGELTIYPLPAADQAMQPRAILCDHDGAIWIGTWGNGLIHAYQGRMDHFTQADGLSSDTVVGLFEDQERNIWVATDGGLDKFRDFAVTTITKREGLSAAIVSSVFPSRDGGVWVGSPRGLNYLRGAETVVDNKQDGLPAESIISIFEESSRRLWVDTTAGLAYRENGRFFVPNTPVARGMRFITAMVEAGDHSIWFSDAERGLVLFRDGHLDVVAPWSQFGNKQGDPLELDRKTNGLWLGFVQGGIAYYKPGEPTRWYTAAHGLGAGRVHDLRTGRDGALWIATDNGFSRLKDGGIETLETDNGLPCGQIHDFVQDDSGALWLNTPCGLIRIQAADLARWAANPKARVNLRVFDASDGVRSRPQSSGYFRRAVKSADGRLWFARFDGVAVVDPKNLRENKRPPPLEIQEITADGKKYPLTSEVHLPPRTKSLQIDYAALSFAARERVRFKCRLDGFDTGWQETGTRPQAIYTNLSPRRYRFRVIACNNDGVWNWEGASLAFTIEPAFYQKIWFQSSSAGAVVALFWVLYRLRLHKIEAGLRRLYEERLSERTRIARDLHDTLLQNIAGFALQLDALSKKVSGPLSAKEALVELRRDAEAWQRDARQSVWDIRQPDGLDLLAAIRQAGQEVVNGQPIRFDVVVIGTRRPVRAALQTELLLIAKEAMRNAISHGKATALSVQITYLDKNMRVRIGDDGCGFVPEDAFRTSGHFGLSAMRERAQQIGAELKIKSEPGRGSVVEIELPIGGSKHGSE